MVDELEMVGLVKDAEPLPAAVFDQARAVLLAAMVVATVPDLLPATTSIRQGRRAWAARGALGLGAAAAAVAVALITTTSTPSHASHQPPETGLPVVGHVNAPLMHLADYITANDPHPAGDATLVLRTQVYPDDQSITGADLYTDRGEYFYAETETGLPAAIAADDDVGGGVSAREVAAAVDAVHGNLGTARHDMAVAPFAPGTPPPWDAPTSSAGQAAPSAAQAAAQAALREKAAAAAKAAGAPTVAPLTASSGLSAGQIDNYIWMDSLDALSAGAGNPQVRAGVLRILSTLPEVTVTETSVAGQAALTLTASAPALPINYQEALTISSTTGTPISFTGGTPGQTPGVTITYQVSRVLVSDIAAGTF